jgi:hypothetical protein
MKTNTAPTRKYISLSNGTIVNLQLVIDDIASFNRYVLKEHGNSMQGDDVFGKTPAQDCVANCLYDELSGWLDNPSMLGFTVLDITFDQNKINEESVELSTEGTKSIVSTFDLVKFIGEIASKDHSLENGPNGSQKRLLHLREKARALLQNLAQVPIKST